MKSALPFLLLVLAAPAAVLGQASDFKVTFGTGAGLAQSATQSLGAGWKDAACSFTCTSATNLVLYLNWGGVIPRYDGVCRRDGVFVVVCLFVSICFWVYC